MLSRLPSFTWVLLSATLLASCSSSETSDSAAGKLLTPTPSSPANAPLDAVRITATQPAQSLSLPGELESYFQTDITPRVGGYVKKLYADIGSHVRQGQVLADLDAPELTAALSEARPGAPPNCFGQPERSRRQGALPGCRPND